MVYILKQPSGLPPSPTASQGSFHHSYKHQGALPGCLYGKQLWKGTGEMPQWSRAPTLLNEDQVWFPLYTWCLTVILNSTSRASNTLFWLPWAPGTYTIQTCGQNAPKIGIKNFFLIVRRAIMLSKYFIFYDDPPSLHMSVWWDAKVRVTRQWGTWRSETATFQRKKIKAKVVRK